MESNNMDLNSNYLLIPIILLASLSIYPVIATELDGFSKQHRLFNKLGNNWAAMEVPVQDETPFDETEDTVDPALLFLEEFLKSRQRPPVVNPENDPYPEGSRYENERDIQSSIPYGVQNVYDASVGRPTRSKNHHKSTFQSLCPSKRETVFLNMDPDYEYRPDYYEEVRCANTVVYNENKIQAAVCGEAGFTCIQLNGTLFLTRRPRGDGCWESETRTVAAGCECMWPKHHLGDIMAHH